MKFENTFQTLPDFLYEEVSPTPVTSPKLMHVSDLKKEIPIDLSEDELVFWLNGEKNLPGEQRISTRYAGHQFGVWAGQLGDGRAISLGEINKYEIQTKGSGLTPFSRMGDGKAVIRSSVREYLCSIAMRGLKIPTTDVLALITGKDEVIREKIERSAIVARVFPSNIRFGHFEMCYHYDKKTELKALIDYTQSQFYPGLSIEEMLQEIVSRTAKLVAHWQSVGFCHGVMNTDNMSILGLTIDYGPFGFLEDTVLNYICNHSDHQGRYAYHRQPSVALWNLERLLVCFMDHVSKEKLESMLNSYKEIFESENLRLFRLKLGIPSLEKQPLDDLLMILHKNSIDFTYFFREHHNPEFWEYYGKMEELKGWISTYNPQPRNDINPKYILRNYIAQEVIEEVEGDINSKLLSWIKILQDPFSEHQGFENYARPTPPSLKNITVSCSS